MINSNCVLEFKLHKIFKHKWFQTLKYYIDLRIFFTSFTQIADSKGPGVQYLSKSTVKANVLTIKAFKH